MAKRKKSKKKAKMIKMDEGDVVTLRFLTPPNGGSYRIYRSTRESTAMSQLFPIDEPDLEPKKQKVEIKRNNAPWRL